MRVMLGAVPAILSALIALSCGNASDKSTQDNSSENKQLTNTDPDAKGGNTCLLGYADKLDKLLTMEAAAAVAQLPAGEAKVTYFTAMKNTDYHNVKYAWKSDRKRSLKDAGIDMEVPTDNMIQLNGIKARSLKSFQMTHRAPTDEELKQLDKAMNDAFDKKSGNKTVNEQVEKLDKMNIDKGTQKSVAKSMGGAFEKVTKAYVEVSGIGEAASWNSVEHCLYVLDNGVEISVTVDLSDDDAVNKEKAMALLTQLLAKCR